MNDIKTQSNYIKSQSNDTKSSKDKEVTPMCHNFSYSSKYPALSLHFKDGKQLIRVPHHFKTKTKLKNKNCLRFN